MPGGDGGQLIEGELETKDLALVTLFEINLNLAFGQGPGGNLAHAQILVHHILTGGELIQTSRKIGRNLTGRYKFFKVGMHT